MTDFSSAAKGIRWNLKDLYDSYQDPKIEIDLKTAFEKARAFETAYRPLLEKPPAEKFPLTTLINDYKAIVTLCARLGSFAHLSFADKTDSAEAGAFLQRIQSQLTEVQSHLVFFDVLWSRLPEKEASRILALPEAEAHRHFLEVVRIYAPHTLSEPEEKILAEKANTSRRAFARLFDELLNNVSFLYDGEKKTESDVLALLHSSDREKRRKASLSLATGLEENTRVIAFTFNRILEDHRIEMKLRGYKHPMDPRNLANETTLDQIQGLIKAVKGAYPLAQRYYKLKKEMLGLADFFDYDRYAPLEKDKAQIPFSECRKICSESYHAFSPEAGRIVDLFFDQNWIDAEVRPGKRGGGFCAQTTPDLHPYILVNYTGSMRDVMTVAHELGHGLHQVLAGKRVGILESGAPLTMAETASVFGEMLIFSKLLEKETDPARRLTLIAGKIDDNFATVFRQVAMTDFELMAHEAGLKEGELAAEKLSAFWMDANQQFYGSSVTLTEAYRHGWKYIPHFVHTPFYCYAYAFAQLFVFALFQKYKEDPAGFIPKYFEILSLGGSRKPEEIAAIAGLDLGKADFWKLGLDVLEELVSHAEKLASDTEKKPG